MFLLSSRSKQMAICSPFCIGYCSFVSRHACITLFDTYCVNSSLVNATLNICVTLRQSNLAAPVPRVLLL